MTRASWSDWLLFGNPAMNVRVPATLEAVLDPDQYEAFTCAETNPSSGLPEVKRKSDGTADWRWQKDLPPMTSAGVRFAVAAVVMAAFTPMIRRAEGGTNPRSFVWVTVGVCNFAVSYGVVYAVETVLPSGIVTRRFTPRAASRKSTSR